MTTPDDKTSKLGPSAHKPLGEGSDMTGAEAKEGEIPTFALPRCIVDIMEDEEGDENVPTDHQYFNAMLAAETCRALSHTLGAQNRSQYFQLKTAVLSKRTTLGKSLDELLQTLVAKLHAIRKRMEVADQAPLIEKFLDALNANEEEKEIFRFVLCATMMPEGLFTAICETPRVLPNVARMYESQPVSGIAGSSLMTPVAISQMFAMPLPRIMRMLTADSVWVKEQLYYNNSESRPATSVNILSPMMEGPGQSVLVGFTVTLSQYEALKSSVMQKVLLDHPPFRESDAGRRALKRSAVVGQQLSEKDAPMSERTNQLSALANALKMNGANGKGGPIGTHHLPGSRGKRDRLFDALAMSAQAERGLELHGHGGIATASAMLAQAGSGLELHGLMGGMATAASNAFKLGTDLKAEASIMAGPKPEKKMKLNDDDFGSYTSELSYLEDQCRANKIKQKIVQLEVVLDSGNDDDLDDVNQPEDLMGLQQMIGRAQTTRRLDENTRFQKEKMLEKTKSRLDQLQRKIEFKILASLEEDNKIFRMEQLCAALHLGDFEKSCILFLLEDVIVPSKSGSSRAMSWNENINLALNPNRGALVGTLISSFCSSIEDKMRSRSFFYKSSTMIEEGVLTLYNDDFTADLNLCQVRLDRRLFDWIVGLDTEMSEIVDGSHLYKPDISVDDVILPEKTKKRVLDAVLSFNKVKDVIHETGMDEKISYGLGQVMLFYGASGTGKTMLANALASKLGVKILLVNFPDFGSNSSGAIIKFLFREARINKALLFFDECESVFMSRKLQGGKGSINMLLTELERFDGICILATNLAHDLDEAMHRRISLSVEFSKPDHIMREKLWKAIQPPKLPVDDKVNFALLGRKYELVGGTIKNAWIQSISIMIQRDGDKVTMEDLEQSASEQVRNQLTSEEFDRRVVPEKGIDTMILDTTVKESLNSVVQYSKAQSVLFGQWGFDKIHRSTSGISVLFHGEPGTGKTMAAEAIGFDLGRPLLVVNVAELMSKWVGETGKNISKIFATAKSKDAILVFDEAEGLFGSRTSSDLSTSRHDTLNVGLLLQLIENHSGICVVITNMKDSIDKAFFRRFRFVLEFKQPSAKERERIWKITLPEQCPVASNVDFRELARRFEMSGGGIKNALLRAATMAALRMDGQNSLKMQDLVSACEAEEGKLGGKFSSINMYS